jgi:hypothetical protein
MTAVQARNWSNIALQQKMLGYSIDINTQEKIMSDRFELTREIQ